jgi:hypothetical protein
MARGELISSGQCGDSVVVCCKMGGQIEERITREQYKGKNRQNTIKYSHKQKM